MIDRKEDEIEFRVVRDLTHYDIRLLAQNELKKAREETHRVALEEALSKLLAERDFNAESEQSNIRIDLLKKSLDLYNVIDTVRDEESRSNARRRDWNRKERFAGNILLFACSSPDDAEAATGDLIERIDAVREGRKEWFVKLYFWWELLLLTCLKARQRLGQSVIPKRLRRWLEGS